MYSISSSDNDYCPGFCYDSGFRGAENVPIYPYVGGQPLVYYSHIAQDGRPQKNKISKKNNPNCFVKAFRWYTQELPSPQLVAPCNNVNIGGFATWLDKKYEEYLHDSQCENNCLQYRSKQCSITKSDRTINRMEYTPRRTRRFPRLKSPWKRKRRYINETETDILCEKQSFEFILRPQDLSRPASECCHKTSHCVRSDTTFITSKSAIPTKNKKKSISVICIAKPKDELERDIKIITHDVSQCNKRQKSDEISKIVTELTEIRNQKLDSKSPMKPNTKYIICDCYNKDLECGMHHSNVATTRNQNKTVHCQCAMKNVPSESEKQNAFKKVSYNELHEHEYHVKRNINTQRSEEETRIVTENVKVTPEILKSTSPIKLNTKDINCACNQLDFKKLSSRNKIASRRNCYKTVSCQCSMSNFRKDESCQHIESNVSNIFRKISRDDFNNNEYDDNKCNIKRQTSEEKTKAVTKYTEQTYKKQDSNSRMNRKSRDVICECKQDNLDLNNVMTQYKLTSKVHNKTFNCQCTGNDIRTDKDRQHFENKEQCISRKGAHEKIYQTCCPCPQPLEPRLQQTPQIRQSSKNFSVVKMLKYKEPFNSKELPVHSVQTSDHSIRFQEDSFLVKLI